MDSAKPSRRRTRSRDPQIIREEVLRPSHYLGYDRDEMGVYFLGREAYEMAESQFRRAVWLNPYEPIFKAHWAMSLIRLKRITEAHDVLAQALQGGLHDGWVKELWKRYWPDESRPAGEEAPAPDSQPDITPGK